MPIAACLRWSLLAVVAFPPDNQADCQPQQQTICCDVVVPSYERTRETEWPALTAIFSCTTEFAPNIASLIRFSQIVDMGKFYSLWLDLVAKSGRYWLWDYERITRPLNPVSGAGINQVIGVIFAENVGVAVAVGWGNGG